MTALKIVSFLGLVLTILPSILVLAGVFSLDTYKNLTLIGSVLWFVSAPFWINKPKEKKTDSLS